ncbi:beta-lactamase family protein [Algibacter sp.]|nr:serine hydrolase domain-containing protein [Algibacter sp.]MDB4274028.1 beta-lactamase family protein [Algibacter sp.]
MRIFILVLLSAVSLNSIGQVKNDSLISFVSSRIDSLQNGFAISIAVIDKDEITYIGLMKENEQIVVKDLKDSLFEIGSLTKVFTSTLLAHEVVNNKLKLTEKINKDFPYKFNNKIKLNYRDLANHTSGLYRLPSNILPALVKNPNNPYSDYSYELFDHYLHKELQLSQSETSRYSYSNLGAGILAYGLSQRREKPFEALLYERVFNQYNMSNTTFDVNTSFHGINAGGKVAENWQFNALKGAGGLISNSSDLSKFIVAQFDTNNCTLSLTREETHSVSDNMSIGLGWHILNPKNSDLKYWHNGGTGGFTSSVSFRVANKTGVIVLSNISALHKQSIIIDELCFELLDMLK